MDRYTGIRNNEFVLSHSLAQIPMLLVGLEMCRVSIYLTATTINKTTA